jgi:hypothetical protein
MMKAGKYYIGDLCYVMHDVWDEVCGILFADNPRGNEGEFTLKDGRRFAAYFTAYGDGSYYDQHNASYSVDAGMIGCILESDIVEYTTSWGATNSTNGGQIIEFDIDFPTGKRDTGRIEIGDICIETDGDYYEDDGQPDEAQEWHDYDPDC